MGFLDGLRGKESPDKRMKRLWKRVFELGSSEADYREKTALCTELLGLVNESTRFPDMCAVLHQRACSHQVLKNYDAALEDFEREIQIYQRRGNQFLVGNTRRVMQQSLWLLRHAVVEEGGERAEKFLTIDGQAKELSSSEPTHKAFEALFAFLQDADALVRADSAERLSDSAYATSRLAAVYRECGDSDPGRASLAGRVLGRKMARGYDDIIPADVARLRYGISASFLVCGCAHCGHFNKGIPAPPKAPYVAYYAQKDDRGAYAVPVLCDACGQGFFVVWDRDPR
jgi:hypothetical protein